MAVHTGSDFFKATETESPTSNCTANSTTRPAGIWNIWPQCGPSSCRLTRNATSRTESSKTPSDALTNC